MELCYSSGWQVAISFSFFFQKRIKRQTQNRSDSQDLWLNAERQAVGIKIKYTSVLFTACLLWTAPLTTPMSIHTMDTTFNTATRARALNSLVTVALHHPLDWFYLQHIELLQNITCPTKISQPCHISVTKFWTCEYTNSVSTTLSLHKAWRDYAGSTLNSFS